MRLRAFRWAVGGDAGCLVWRLRLGLATLAPGGLGLTVRPYYEGLPLCVGWTRAGRTAAKAAGIRASGMLPVRSRKNGAEDTNRHRWSAERRAGRRYRPVIPGDPGIGPTARRTTRCGVPHQRLSALCSPR